MLILNNEIVRTKCVFNEIFEYLLRAYFFARLHFTNLRVKTKQCYDHRPHTF